MAVCDLDIAKLKDIFHQGDMLKADICRMCITEDVEELETMYEIAKQRLYSIYQINKQRFT